MGREIYIMHHIEPECYKQGRADHITQLMYYSKQFVWNNALDFHKDVLPEIESGRESWGMSFDYLKARCLNQTRPRQYYALFQRGICEKKEQGLSLILMSYFGGHLN